MTQKIKFKEAPTKGSEAKKPKENVIMKIWHGATSFYQADLQNKPHIILAAYQVEAGQSENVILKLLKKHIETAKNKNTPVSKDLVTLFTSQETNYEIIIKFDSYYNGPAIMRGKLSDLENDL